MTINSPTITVATLRQVGEACFGTQWRAPMARALGYPDRTIRRWLDGTYRMPAALDVELRELVRRRQARLQRALERLARAAPGTASSGAD